MKKISFLIITLLILPLVSSFGISSPHWKGNPLELAIGEAKTINLNAQNTLGDEDITIKAEIIEGSEIITLDKDAFTIKAKSSDTIIPLKIKMPEQSSPGETKNILIEFKTINDNAGGISIGTGMSVSFDVIAKPKVQDSNKTPIIRIIITIAILLAISLILFKKRKNKF